MFQPRLSHDGLRPECAGDQGPSGPAIHWANPTARPEPAVRRQIERLDERSGQELSRLPLAGRTELCTIIADRRLAGQHDALWAGEHK